MVMSCLWEAFVLLSLWLFILVVATASVSLLCQVLSLCCVALLWGEVAHSKACLKAGEAFGHERVRPD